jgi:hypothetical protein
MLHTNGLPGLLFVFQSLCERREIARNVCEEIEFFSGNKEIVTSGVLSIRTFDTLAKGGIVLANADLGRYHEELPKADALFVLTDSPDSVKNSKYLYPYCGITTFEIQAGKNAGISWEEYSGYVARNLVRSWIDEERRREEGRLGRSLKGLERQI